MSDSFRKKLNVDWVSDSVTQHLQSLYCINPTLIFRIDNRTKCVTTISFYAPTYC
jgi:hypothetical protein